MSHSHASTLPEQILAPLLQHESSGCDSGQDALANISVTRARWWMLMQYSLLTFNQGWYWDIPGPIFLNYIATYNVSQDTLQLFVNYGSIFFLLFSLPIAFLLDRPNCFRVAVLMSAACNLTGCILRLLARSTSLYSIILLHASYIINAIGAPVAISAPALLANAWFPPSERGLATGIAVACNTFGLVFSYFIGPLMVPSPGFDGVMNYMYVCAASAALNFVCIAVYFPSAPLQPPSISAAVYAQANAEYNWQSAKSHLIACGRNRTFVILALSYGVIGGLYSGWSALESPNLSSLGVSENTAGILSGSSIFVAAAAAVALGSYTDRSKNHKQTLLVLLLAGAAAVVVWSLLHHGLLPLPQDDTNKFSLLAALSVLIAVGFYSCTPIFFEAAIEASHPLPQGGVIMLMTIVFNISSIAMLAIPAEGTAFNWLLCSAAVLVTVLLVAKYENQNKRSQLEEVR